MSLIYRAVADVPCSIPPDFYTFQGFHLCALADVLADTAGLTPCAHTRQPPYSAGSPSWRVGAGEGAASDPHERER